MQVLNLIVFGGQNHVLVLGVSSHILSNLTLPIKIRLLGFPLVLNYRRRGK